MNSDNSLYVSERGRCHLVSVYTVRPSHSKWQGVEQQTCIKFCIKLEHSSTETLWMIHKAFRGNATAMDNWWLAASSQQCINSCITSCTEFFRKTSNHLGDSAPLQPRFGTLQLLAFPKTNITLKGKRSQTIDEIQENTTGQLMAMGELCEVPRCLLWRGLRCRCPLYNVSCIFFNKCLYFSYYTAGYLLDSPYTHTHTHTHIYM